MVMSVPLVDLCVLPSVRANLQDSRVFGTIRKAVLGPVAEGHEHQIQKQYWIV